MLDFLLHLFDTADFPARWHCGTWSTGHGWLHILSDLGVFGAYITIPVILIIFVKRRPDTPYPRIFWLFSAFIVSCGLTHLMEAIIFWAPVYRLDGVLKLVTAIVSWATVVALIRVMPNALQLATPDELRAEVERQTAKLRKQNEENERLLEELGRAHGDFDRFAYSVSHDLRAPLRAISGFAEILAEDHGSGLDEEGERVLDVIRRNAGRAGVLIDDLLEFSRVGRAELDREQVDMQALADDAFHGAMERAEGRAIDVEIGELPRTLGDEGMLRQVWNNLAENAVKYTSKTTGARIEVTAERRGGDVRYQVRDNGVGFDDTYVDKIFEVFERLHSDEEFEGTGVGLALVAQIIERHGGRVGARSKPDEGATFWFELPIRE